MYILVTGGAGYIGCHTVRALQKEGFKVVVLDNLIHGHKEIIENVYFKKTVNHFFDKFEPRFKKISHSVQIGETFDSILENYFIDKKEIEVLKNKLNKKINLNKLKTNQKILLIVDQSENSIKEFIFLFVEN